MQTQAIKCNICGAPLPIEANLKSNIMECPYCGNTITISKTQEESISKESNQKNQKAETELLLQQKKKIKIQYDTMIFQAQEGKDKAKKIIIIGAALCLFGFTFLPLTVGGVIMIIVGAKQIKKAGAKEQQAFTEYERDTKMINDKISRC